jgi:hypothetical protein
MRRQQPVTYEREKSFFLLYTKIFCEYVCVRKLSGFLAHRTSWPCYTAARSRNWTISNDLYQQQQVSLRAPRRTTAAERNRNVSLEQCSRL